MATTSSALSASDEKNCADLLSISRRTGSGFLPEAVSALQRYIMKIRQGEFQFLNYRFCSARKGVRSIAAL